MAGGTTLKLAKADWPHLRNSYRSWLRSNSLRELIVRASGLAKASTWTEWSTTRSTGIKGLTFCAEPSSPVIETMADRIAARSTTVGTPVKSWSTTLPGTNGISASPTRVAS